MRRATSNVGPHRSSVVREALSSSSICAAAITLLLVAGTHPWADALSVGFSFAAPIAVGAFRRRERESAHDRSTVHTLSAAGTASSDLNLHAHEIRAAAGSQMHLLAGMHLSASELRACLSDAARTAEQSAELASESYRLAHDGGILARQLAGDLDDAVQVAAGSLVTIGELLSRLEEVMPIAATIASIADRTRLVALNATIQAGAAVQRAGGFVVVVEEIRRLADSSADAAKRIAAILESIRESSRKSAASNAAVQASAQRMREGVANASAADLAFSRIAQSVASLAESVAEVATVCRVQLERSDALVNDADRVTGVAHSTVAITQVLVEASHRIERTMDEVGADPILAAGIEAGAMANALIEIAALLRPVFDVPRQHAGGLLSLYRQLAAVREPFRSADLARLDDTMVANLVRFRREICGVTVAIAPGVLDDAQRWMQWWVNGVTGPSKHEVNVDPQVAGFYDYACADWFVVPRERGQSWLSDPYFDAGGVDTNLVTLSVPCVVASEVIAVATADLNVEQIQEICRPALDTVGHPNILATAAGHVVASSAPQAFPPGSRAPEDVTAALAQTTGPWARTNHCAVARLPTFEWALCVVADHPPLGHAQRTTP
jgi:Methyl-accepting chemotaxis protein (MCP) signalling domain/Methyl-accepting chemotaxis protein-like, first PDC sensor domain